MEKQENKSKWDELAREIGAEVSPEIVEREEAASSRSESDMAAARSTEHEAAEHAPPPKRTAVDWNSLVTELGLPPLPPEPETEPEPEPALKPTSTPPQRVVAREEPRREPPSEREERRPRRERPQRQDSRRERRRDEESRAQREEREPREVEEESRERPEREGRRRRGRGEGRRPSRERGERERDQREERVETEREEVVARDATRRRDELQRPEIEPVRDEERAEGSPKQPEPAREEPLKSAAISLWHKIFGTPAEQTAKLTEERIEEEAAAPPDLREDRHDTIRRAEVEFDEYESAKPAAELERGEDSALVGDEESAEPRRGRPRRRRGRGRGRRPERESVEGDASDQLEGQARTSERTGRRRRHRDEPDEDLGGEELSHDHERQEETDEGDDAELVSAGVSRRSALQRAIPSWDEAIGMIVDANMQNRSQRKPPSRSGSRDGGGGRGRPRGRRRQQ